MENNFRDVRPNLEAVGVEMVESVIPYEEAKIRILNASHSCIARAGTLIGQQYIHESTLTDVIYAIADRYVTEDVIPCLGDNGIDLPTYRDVVLKRFTNPYIRDTNQRVAADGFSKIPAMIAPTLQECYQRGVRPEATAMLPALFFVFMEQWHKGTLPYQYRDGIRMRRRCMRCSRLRIRWLSTRAIKPCLVISPTTRISGADARESRRRLHAD